MSLDGGNLLGCYTELEIAAGIPDLAEGRDRGYLDDEDERTETFEAELRHNVKQLTHPYDLDKRAVLSQEIVELNSSADTKSVTIRRLVTDNLDYAIFRFGKKEEIPDRHLKLVKDHNIIQSMIKGLISRSLTIDLTTGIVDEVEGLVRRLQRNEELETPYFRTSEIQRYVHEKARLAFGVDGHKMLNRAHMRVLLSLSRSHLSIVDLERPLESTIGCQSVELENKSIPSNYFGYLFNKSILQAQLEDRYPNAKRTINGEYKRKWNVRFMKPFSYYCDQESREKIERVLALEQEKDLLTLKESCVNIYSRIMSTMPSLETVRES